MKTDEVLFRMGKSGMYCRLVYAGNSVWRLQADPRGKNFESVGAAQSFAKYLKEEPFGECRPFLSEKKDGILTLTADTGASVTVGGEPFAVTFRSPEGEVLSVLTKIASEKGQTRVCGTLDKKEAVYGGGEKFDTSNKRGTSFSLYTGDMWNNSKGIYMAVPLFLFTRGAGLFFNHYQNILADFGEKRKNQWSALICAKFLDAYIVATGDMKDGLSFYSDLTGHAAVPAVWNYGPIACRYTPDFDHLWSKDDVPGMQNKDGAPGGRGFETMVRGYQREKMPLNAVITEGWLYQRIFDSEEEEALWQEAINWLHGQNVKVMLYARLASDVPTGALSGFREEYLLHASVTVDGVTTETADIPDTMGDGVNPDIRRGATHRYIDITNPKAVKWYVDGIWGKLIQMGFDGVKIDFCEALPDAGMNYGGITVKYHWHNPSKIRKGTEHHAYPTYFITHFYKRMNELTDKKYKGKSDGFMVLCRGGGIGSQRNPFLWGGDQTRCFEKLSDQLLCTVNCGLSGVPFMTYDMAGYRYDKEWPKFTDPDCEETEAKILSRAVEFTALTPCIQTHGTVRSPYELAPYAKEIYRLYVQLHAELTEYIDRYCRIASETGIPPVRHLVLKYPKDTAVYSLNDQFLLGDGLLVAPILKDHTDERKVYLPAGNWLNVLTGRTAEGGKVVTVKANIGQIPLFIDTSSPDFGELSEIFGGETFKRIRNFKQ